MTTVQSYSRNRHTDDSLTLYCLAHAGGSAAVYRRWSDFLPASVRVRPLELPGHGTRIREPLVEDLQLLVAELVRTIRPAADGERFAVFGHSFGAILGVELARRLHQLEVPPVALLVGGRNGPAEPLSHRPIHSLPDDKFVTALSRYGGLPESLLAEPDLLRLFLPAIRNDLRLVETYARPSGPALDVPVTAFAGRRDRLTDAQGVLGWARETTAEFDLTLLPGGHFFLNEPAFPPVLSARLARLTSGAQAVEPSPPLRT
ncbi:thioesterase [Streptomyces armeniacus]|uniref:Thioesterase n=1 Tax=Streptomyces armeniacus TaxID=83291 RepID=A0A345XUY0_9ACTN|nr:alpha/beta fold hydrolase [Streptomyces armeniacus]AWS21291.1 type II thioesterase [Streptomyces armeniacus]AXK35446.1 thioesterase [Streptomyces armeniacus]AZY92015.1 putative type II thioesterase [Streptomyces armeniacus]